MCSFLERGKRQERRILEGKAAGMCGQESGICRVVDELGRLAEGLQDIVSRWSKNSSQNLYLLMKESDPIRRTISKPTNILELAQLSTPRLNPLRPLIKRTAPAGSMVATRDSNDSVVDIDPDEHVVSLRLAVDVVWVEWRIVPTVSCRRTSQALDDEAAAHWDELRGAPEPVGQCAVRGQGRVGEEV
ncbi:hypothetical protein LTR28_011830 [Elasticomyces elasticus]|nr:hypothetical protein LTR28_011830 [Elasticomyces elasticus]